MTKKGIFAIFLYFLILLSIIVLGASVAGPIIGALLGIILGAVLSAGATLFKPFRHWLENFTKENIRLGKEKYRVLIFGLPRSGKTSVLKRIITADKPTIEDSTGNFDIYDETLRLGLKNPERYQVSFADYQGQKPSQISSDPPENFFGLPEQRTVNAILFIVDLFPEIRDEKGKVLDNISFFEKYKENALELIEKRVKDNLQYINQWTIEPVFTVCYNERYLWSVRLLINKTDLLREIISRGYIPNITLDDLDEFALKYYTPIEVELQEACAQNNIQDFSVHLLSAATGENINNLMGELLAVYSRRKK